MFSSIKNISLYIPHVFLNFDKKYIANVFKSFGEIDHIDIIGKLDRNQNEYNAVYIHFKMWHDTQYNRNFQNELLSDNEKRVMWHIMWSSVGYMRMYNIFESNYFIYCFHFE